MGSVYQLEKTIFFPSPVGVVFKFHTCMENICRLLPEHLNVTLVAAPPHVKLGDTVRLKVWLRAICFPWETTIVEYEKNVFFADIMEHGPFSYWRHEHIFVEEDGGTLMTDRVEYQMGFGVFGGFASRFFIQGEVERIFASRHEKARQHFQRKKKRKPQKG